MLTSASLAVFLVELVKELAKKLTKNPEFEFNPKVMAALLVVANAASSLILAFLGVAGYEIPTDWVSWTKALALAILGALVSSGLYVMGLKPFKAFSQRYYFENKQTR